MKEAIKLIGHTPMYHLQNTNIKIKLEKFNPAGSIKDRAVYGMLEDAFEHQRISEHTKLIEATSGNTGIALAMLSAIYQIPVTIIMPDSMSIERRQLMQAYGAELVLSEGAKGMQGAVDLMNQYMQNDETFLSLRQFDNPANADIHERTTGVEILEQAQDTEIFVACVGTGGTFTGIARALKKANPKIRCIAAEPTNSALLSGHESGAHKIQGIGANFIPSILDTSLIDDILLIDDDEALKETKAFAQETGILVGISSGANIALAKRLSKYYPDKKIVTIAPDGGEKYLSVLNSL